MNYLNSLVSITTAILLSTKVGSILLTSISLQNQNFTVGIDTASFSTLLPTDYLNGYTGPIVKLNKTGTDILEVFGDGSFYEGYQSSIDMFGKRIEVVGMTGQSIDPKVLNDDQGLLGIGYGSRLLQDLEATRVVIRYGKWIEFGNSKSWFECQGDLVRMPSRNFYSVDMIGISIAAQYFPSPWQFQKFSYSILDSATTQTFIPDTIFTKFRNMIKESNALSKNLSSAVYLDQFLDGKLSISNLTDKINLHLLPNLTIHMPEIKLVFTPQDYFRQDQEGWTRMAIGGKKDFGILGLMVFEKYLIEIDQLQGTLLFSKE